MRQGRNRKRYRNPAGPAAAARVFDATPGTVTQQTSVLPMSEAMVPGPVAMRSTDVRIVTRAFATCVVDRFAKQVADFVALPVDSSHYDAQARTQADLTVALVGFGACVARLLLAGRCC